MLLRPLWDAPSGTGALMSTRTGGFSAAPFDSLNLGIAVGDEPSLVAANRQRFVQALGAAPVWLQQVHGTGVRRVGSADLTEAPPVADAAWTDEPGIACTVQVADCLPVLMAAPAAPAAPAAVAAVAAVHAGWRGLAGGVLEAALGALCAGARCPPEAVVVWLGPCIGPQAFEVGAEVLQAFGVPAVAADQPLWRFAPRADGAWRWRADLAGLARRRLQQSGVQRISAHGGCTFEGASDFFSFRRDGHTGRMAAAIWIERR